MKTAHNIGIILLLILFSCNKDDDNRHQNPCFGIQPSTSYITSPDLQNCMYKTGSYWVFLDSISNTIDSVSIINFHQTILYGHCDYDYEIHSIETISSDSMESIDYVITQGGLFKDFTGGINSGTQIYGAYDSSVSMTNYLVEKFDSTFIYDRYYHTVLKVEIEDDPTENDNRSVYFINSDYGFLRHDIYSGSNLLSNKVLIDKSIIR